MLVTPRTSVAGDAPFVIDELAAAQRGVDAELVNLANRQHHAAPERHVEVAEHRLDAAPVVLDAPFLDVERVLAEAAAQRHGRGRVGSARRRRAIGIGRGVEARERAEAAPADVDVEPALDVDEARARRRRAVDVGLADEARSEIAVIRGVEALDDADAQRLVPQAKLDRVRRRCVQQTTHERDGEASHFNEIGDVIGDQLLVAGVVAVAHARDDAAAIDEHRHRRHALRVVDVDDARLLVEQRGKRQVVAARERDHLRHRLGAVHGDAEDDEAVALARFVELLELRQLGRARHAPGRPEIEQHHLAAVVAQVHLPAVEIAQREVARLRAGDDATRARPIPPSTRSRRAPPRATRARASHCASNESSTGSIGLAASVIDSAELDLHRRRAHDDVHGERRHVGVLGELERRIDRDDARPADTAPPSD